MDTTHHVGDCDVLLLKFFHFLYCEICLVHNIIYIISNTIRECDDVNEIKIVIIHNMNNPHIIRSGTEFNNYLLLVENV